MANVPEEFRYTKDHEYVKDSDEPGILTVGITDYAQGELGDVVYVNLPAIGQHFDEHQVFGTIEAVKAVSDLYCPIAGEVVAVNPLVEADPASVNRSPYVDGWMIRLRPDNPADRNRLLTADAYRAHTGS